MAKYKLTYNKLVVNSNCTTDELFVDTFEGPPKALKEHVKKMWSQGCCNVAAYKEGTTYRKKRRVQLKVDYRELSNINIVLEITKYALFDHLFNFPELPDIEEEYAVNCGNGFTAKFNVLKSLKDTGGNYKFWVDSLLYLDDTVVCHPYLNESFEGEFHFEVGEEVVIVEVIPDMDAVMKSFEPETINIPKLLISVSTIDDEIDGSPITDKDYFEEE
jgi:hypothetical protein